MKPPSVAEILADIDAKVAAIPPDNLKEFALTMQAELEGRPYDPAPDTELAIRWLEGYEDADERGLPVQRYLTGAEAAEARNALVRLLMSDEGPNMRVRVALADMFGGYLRLSPRLSGSKDYYLAREIWEKTRSGVSIEEAVEGEDGIAKEYGISARTVWRAWAKYKILAWVRFRPED